MQNIKLNTDGVDSSSILDEDLSGVDTSFPLLPDSVQTFEIISVEEVENNAKTGNNLVISMKTTKENLAQGTNDAIQAGFPCKTYIGLVPSKRYTPASIKKAAATFVQAVGTTSLRPYTQYTGKMVDVKVGTNPAKGSYPPSNSFKFVPLKK